MMIVITFIFISIILIILYILCIKTIKPLHLNQSNNRVSKSNINIFKTDKKSILNGEYKDKQVIYINRYNVAEMKLPYELISAKKSVLNSNDEEFAIDDENKYYEFHLEDEEDSMSLMMNREKAYKGLYEINDEFFKNFYEFIKKSEFIYNSDIVRYYKYLVSKKKMNDDEVEEFIIFYKKIKSQFERLHELERNKKINKAIESSTATSGYEQSKLCSELQESIRKKDS